MLVGSGWDHPQVELSRWCGSSALWLNSKVIGHPILPCLTPLHLPPCKTYSPWKMHPWLKNKLNDQDDPRGRPHPNHGHNSPNPPPTPNMQSLKNARSWLNSKLKDLDEMEGKRRRLEDEVKQYVEKERELEGQLIALGVEVPR